MDNYIVRVYRCEKDNPREFIGIVEEAGMKGSRPFTSYDELWEILNKGKKDTGGINKQGIAGGDMAGQDG